MKKSKNLRIIGVARGGVENVDLEAATQNGIAVFNAAGRNANAVSDFTVGMIFSEIRNIAKCHHQIKEGVAKLRFPNSDFTPDMKGKTLGLVGFGNIGRLVAKKMAGFEVNILTYDPFLTQEALEGTNHPGGKRGIVQRIGHCQHSCAFDKGYYEFGRRRRNFINEATFLFRKYSKGRTG